MKITLVFITYRYSHIFHRESGVLEQKCRLRKPFFLHMLGIGFARSVLYLVTEPIEIVVQKLCRLAKKDTKSFAVEHFATILIFSI